jgi:hypothetical protein
LVQQTGNGQEVLEGLNNLPTFDKDTVVAYLNDMKDQFGGHDGTDGTDGTHGQGGQDGQEYGRKGGPNAFMNILEELMRGLGD